MSNKIKCGQATTLLAAIFLAGCCGFGEIAPEQFKILLPQLKGKTIEQATPLLEKCGLFVSPTSLRDRVLVADRTIGTCPFRRDHDLVTLELGLDDHKRICSLRVEQDTIPDVYIIMPAGDLNRTR